MDSHFMLEWSGLWTVISWQSGLVYGQSFHAKVVWSMDSHFMTEWSGRWAGWSGLWAGFGSCQGGLCSMSRVSFHARVVCGQVSFHASVVYGQGSTFVSCQGGLWSMGSVHFMPGLSLVYRQGSFHARVVYGQCHVMPGWSMGSVVSCQGGLWAVSCHAREVYGQGVHVMPVWSMGSVMSCQGGLWARCPRHASVVYGQCHFMPEWSLVSGQSSFYARFVYRLFCCFRLVSNFNILKTFFSAWCSGLFGVLLLWSTELWTGVRGLHVIEGLPGRKRKEKRSRGAWVSSQ